MGLEENQKKPEDWCWVSYEIQKQERNGQKSDLYIDGKHIPPEVVQKEISRHVATLEQALHRANTAPSPQRPDGYIMVTPAQECSTVSRAHDTFAYLIDFPKNGIVDVEVAYSARNKYKNLRTLNLEDLSILFKTLLDCCAFVTIFDFRTHISSKEMSEFYYSMARSIFIVSNSPQDYIVRARSAFLMISFDILLSTCRDDIPAVQKIFKSLNISRHKESRYGRIILASLCLAVWKGSPELITTLRDVLPGEPRDRHGQICLYLASRATRLDIIEGLIQSGAAVNAMSYNGFTTWQNLSYISMSSPLFQLLLQAGARTLPNPTDMNFICQAAAFGQVEAVRDLLRRRPDLSRRTPSGWAPLAGRQGSKAMETG